MPNTFLGKGNLADTPTIKYVPTADGERVVAEMRVFFDKYGRNDEGDIEQTGGFWMKVSLWGDRGEQAARLLRRGSRVSVEGTLEEFMYTVEGTDIKVPGYQVRADDVTLTMGRIESVTFRAKRNQEESLPA
ncbi:single-stranded DNA-binding protein [Nitrogeniibacter aestuarii]|uniref:single-stranded DNA-binding protein n=1 Tax=Nitrogeniibacter aestuarii TaxID=2815343 RepID=UPI001E5C0E8E|nr:single-stranded DNA-binding protein [Nitrogeniibacter aestuarii]